MIPRIEFTDEGLVVPTREAVTAGLWQIMREAFGESITQDPRTPQGQLVTSLTAIIRDRDDASVEIANNMDPRYAYGQFQDAVAAIYFLQRKEAVRSVVQLEFIGIGGTVVPEGFVLIDEAGHEWVTAEAGIVGGELVHAECAEPGPIQAAPDTVNIFKQAIAGVDRVTNPAPAAVGRDTESRTDFELRRYESVAANSKNMNASVRGAVDNLPGVIDCFVIDNPRNETITVGETDYPMIRNSLLVSIVGGDDYAIAEQILIKGGTGCAFVGNTEVLYRDTQSGNAFPPEYDVRFLRPDHVETFIRLTVIDPDAISFANMEAAKKHIVNAFQSGADRARIGGMVLGSAYMCGLNSEAVRPVKIELSTDGATWHDYIRFGVDQFPVTSTASVSVVAL